jgi:3D (Asp-Asp-Asp) domain-containing protein
MLERGKTMLTDGIRAAKAATAGALLAVAGVCCWLALDQDALSSTYFLLSSTFSSDRIQFFRLSQNALWLQINATPNRATPMTLWATYYRVHQARSVVTGKAALRDPNGQTLATLEPEDWCHGAMEGTIQVTNLQGAVTTYNYASHEGDTQVDCAPYFANLDGGILRALNKTRFIPSTARYGYGTNKIPLVPYRTIAVDRDRIPIGSVIYIPEARGKVVVLPTGDRVVHDGFFYAADVGGAIQGSHIDVFLGISQQNPFPFISSDPNTPFRAFLIQDPDIVQALQVLHQTAHAARP